MKPAIIATRTNANDIFFIGIPPLEPDREAAEDRLVVWNRARRRRDSGSVDEVSSRPRQFNVELVLPHNRWLEPIVEAERHFPRMRREQCGRAADTEVGNQTGLQTAHADPGRTGYIVGRDEALVNARI